MAAAGPVALLVIGSVLGVAIPRVYEAVFPAKPRIPDVAIVAHHNGHNGDTYFVQAPDWAQLAAEFARCSDWEDNERPVLGLLSRQDCEDETLIRFGGTPVFGSASIDITNAQSASIQIVEVRTVVERRIETRFAAQFQPPVGGPIGTVLGFNLDREIFRARLMKEEENVVPPLTAPPADSRPAYFQAKHLEIEPSRSEHLYVAVMSTYNGIVEWHLEIEYEALNSAGKTQAMTAIVRPPGGPFRGARSASQPAEYRECLAGC